MRRRTLLLSAAAFAGAAHAQQLARASEVVYLHGSAISPHRIYTPEELAAMPADMLASFVQSRGAPGAEQRSTVRGVRLGKLVERSLTPVARADWKNLVVTATATDGYRAQFSWAELTNTAEGEGVLVLFERDGRPLEPREGRIALMATGDFRLGARHVRNLLRIEVRPLAD